jgi:23S rRNA (uracil1939-C5)-methyltransferase
VTSRYTPSDKQNARRGWRTDSRKPGSSFRQDGAKKDDRYSRPQRDTFPRQAREERESRRPSDSRFPSAPQRPPCPHYPACFSCPFIQFPYLQQLEKKYEIVAQAIKHYPSLASLSVPSLVPSQHQFGYRTRAKLAVRRVNGKIVIGLYRPETHDVVDTSACPVHPEPVNEVIQFLREAIERLDIAPYDEAQDRGQLRYIDIRYSLWQKQMVITLVTRHMHFPQAKDLAFHLERKFSFITGIVQNIHDKPGNVIWGDRFHPLRGRDTLLERIGPFRLIVPVYAFSQVNPPVARRIYETALEWANVASKDIVLDLYCGIGPISLYLASKAQLVIGIDDNEGAVNTAKQNARRNGYHNCRFFAGDAAGKLREVTSAMPPMAVAVVNPPRKGLSPEAFDALLGTGVSRIVYISCEPTTLARDLDHFTREGYDVKKVQPFDMFPQTEQVETVALLERKEHP